jgi:hypothetical protein
MRSLTPQYGSNCQYISCEADGLEASKTRKARILQGLVHPRTHPKQKRKPDEVLQIEMSTPFITVLTAQSREMQGKQDFLTGRVLCVLAPKKIEV